MANLHWPLQAATLAFTLSAAPFRAFAGSEAPFHIDSTWKLGGDGSCGYLGVDATAHLLLYRTGLNRIVVADTQTGKPAGKIGGLQHAHGIAFNDQSTVGYISDGGAGTVIVFDRATRKTIAAIPVGQKSGCHSV